MDNNGNYYELHNLRDDQADVAAVVLSSIRKWLERDHFSPCNMTIVGVAGSGKSVLIKTLVTAVRRMFQRNDVVQVCAPTGSAAFSAGGGQTIHHLFGIKIHNSSDELSPTTKKTLLERFSNIIMLIVDERSMVSSEILCFMNSYAKQTFHNGMNFSKSWGGLPVLLLVGDDYQLPPIEKGAFYSLDYPVINTNISINKQRRIHMGHHLFRETGQTVMKLSTSQRTRECDVILARLLEGVRAEPGSRLSEQDNKYLCTNFHIMSPHFTSKDREELCDDALFYLQTENPKIH